MKKVFLILLAMVGFVLGQASVWTSPQTRYWTEVYDGTLSNLDTTTAISIFWWNGTVTMAIETDTTGASVKGANQSDSCLTIGYQLYCRSSDIAKWGPYYNNVDTYVGGIGYFTQIDTVHRDICNRGASAFFIDLQHEADQLAWADSVRFFIGIGITDSLKVVVSVGGQ